MLLGLGFIFWSVCGIWTQTHYSNQESITTQKIFSNNKTVRDVNGKSDTFKPLSQADKPIYPVYPAEGGNIGSLTIPALKRKLTMMQGTGDNELKMGVGHFYQSVLPGEKDNCVI
ncbi:hypothetical protein [Clostridium frigoris]|uniref:hypothetical protein n=1 Tax=Clostridium frigoris TaxID=205327 RepID=UPI001FE26B82|nr:hypothetical protein [Clostridium frigoris]